MMAGVELRALDAMFDEVAGVVGVSASLDVVTAQYHAASANALAGRDFEATSGFDGSLLSEFMAFDLGFTGGVRVAAEDVEEVKGVRRS